MSLFVVAIVEMCEYFMLKIFLIFKSLLTIFFREAYLRYVMAIEVRHLYTASENVLSLSFAASVKRKRPLHVFIVLLRRQ